MGYITDTMNQTTTKSGALYYCTNPSSNEDHYISNTISLGDFPLVADGSICISPDECHEMAKDLMSSFDFVVAAEIGSIITTIKEVNIIVPNKVVEVVFEDGTKEKAVCQEPDVFSFEMAIGICISKKIMGGSSAYNNAIRKGVKIYEKQEKAKAEEEKRKVAAERKRKKRIEKKKRNAELKKAAEKKEKIDIQKEAFIQAMEYMEYRAKCRNES